MKKIFNTAAGVIIATITFSFAAEKNPVHPFPEPESGYVRHVINLPEKSRDEEVNYKVEVVAGATINTDGTNRYRMNTSITPEPLKGWGYTYYVMNGSKQTMSTMMAPIGEQKHSENFVAGTPTTIRYNSRLPIVIYTPEDFEIRYRIWEAPVEFNTATTK